MLLAEIYQIIDIESALFLELVVVVAPVPVPVPVPVPITISGTIVVVSPSIASTAGAFPITAAVASVRSVAVVPPVSAATTTPTIVVAVVVSSSIRLVASIAIVSIVNAALAAATVVIVGVIAMSTIWLALGLGAARRLGIIVVSRSSTAAGLWVGDGLAVSLRPTVGGLVVPFGTRAVLQSVVVVVWTPASGGCV